MRNNTGVSCEACAKPICRGQFVNHYDDVGEVHVDCDAPYAIPNAATINESRDDNVVPPQPREMQTFLMAGDPLMLIAVDHKYLGKIGQER